MAMRARSGCCRCRIRCGLHVRRRGNSHVMTSSCSRQLQALARIACHVPGGRPGRRSLQARARFILRIAQRARPRPSQSAQIGATKNMFLPQSFATLPNAPQAMDGESAKTELMLNGPLTALIFLYDDFLVYRSGVYYPMMTATAIVDA
jgi:hypothetical protein